MSSRIPCPPPPAAVRGTDQIARTAERGLLTRRSMRPGGILGPLLFIAPRALGFTDLSAVAWSPWSVGVQSVLLAAWVPSARVSANPATVVTSNYGAPTSPDRYYYLAREPTGEDRSGH